LAVLRDQPVQTRGHELRSHGRAVARDHDDAVACDRFEPWIEIGCRGDAVAPGRDRVLEAVLAIDFVFIIYNIFN
jgi:hypothetical protein